MQALLSLSDLYDHRLFRIPDYQRGYAWENRQLEDFWEDIINLPAGHIHYTGVVTVERPSYEQCVNWRREDKGFSEANWVRDDDHALLRMDGGVVTPYYVVDGQQRLLTMQILLAAARESPVLSPEQRGELENRFVRKTSDGCDYYLFGYEVDVPSHRFLIETIFNDRPSGEPETTYTDNLKQAKSFFTHHLGNMGRDDLWDLLTTVTARVQFNYYEVARELDVFVVFETMNNRGRVLTKLELLKNRLLYLSTQLHNEDTSTRDGLRATISDQWKHIYEWLAKNRRKPLDDDDFLRNHWLMYFNHDDDKRSDFGSFAEDLLNNRFILNAVRSGDLSADKIRVYVESLGRSVESWFAINFPQHEAAIANESTKLWLGKINEIKPQSFFRPILMAMLQGGYREDDTGSLLRAVERHEFLVFGVADSRSDANRAFFVRRAYPFYDHQIGLAALADEVRSRTGQFYSQKRFAEHVDDLFSHGQGDDRGYWNWFHLKYFLFEYEEMLRSDGPVLAEWSKCDKERVYPKQVERGQSWGHHYGGYGAESKRKLCNSIGNIVLVSRRRVPQEAQYDSFAERKRHPMPGPSNDETGYAYGSYSEREVAESEVWRHKEILERGMRMLAFMAERWEIPLAEDIRKTLTGVNFAIQHQMDT